MNNLSSYLVDARIRAYDIPAIGFNLITVKKERQIQISSSG